MNIFINDHNTTSVSMENQYYKQGVCIDYAVRNMHHPYINPRRVGYQKCLPEHGEDWHKLNWYIIHYVVSGEGTLFSRGKEFPVKAGQAFLICANEVIKYQASKTNPWNYIWIAFDGEITKDFDNITYPVLKVNGDVFEKAKECLKYSNTREIFLISCVAELYCDIFDKSDEFNLVSSIKNYIDTNYMSGIKVADIAASLNISKNHLTRIFKNETGKTPQEYIVKRKMKSAKKLIESGHTVSETAQILGYADQPIFSKAFKKYYGYSPSEKK